MQRHKHKKGKLDDDQISSLDSIGFVWGAQIQIQRRQCKDTHDAGFWNHCYIANRAEAHGNHEAF